MPPLSPAPRSPPAQSASRCPAGPPRPGRIPPWSCWPCAGGRAALRRARRFHKPSPGGGVGQRDGRERRPFSGTVSPSRRPYPERQAAVGEAAAGIGVGDAPKFGRQRRVVHGAVDAVPGEVRQIVGGVENRLRGIGLAVLKQLREGRGGGWEAPQGSPALLISISTAQIPLSRRSAGLSARSQQAALKAPVSSAPSSGLSLQLLVCPVPSSSRAKQSRAAPPSPAGPSAGCAPRNHQPSGPLRHTAGSCSTTGHLSANQDTTGLRGHQSRCHTAGLWSTGTPRTFSAGPPCSSSAPPVPLYAIVPPHT